MASDLTPTVCDRRIVVYLKVKDSAPVLLFLDCIPADVKLYFVLAGVAVFCLFRLEK